ncbi:MAG: protein kinase [Thermoanaerobaculia bacterium]|nr:protein kinase [Thermoanaerobaculia bacterium]
MPTRRSSSDSWRRTWELFHAVLERPVAEREAFLDQHCGSDEELRYEVAELLAAHAAQGPLDRTPLGEEDRTEILTGLPDLEPGKVLSDRFEIRRQLGAGGMGLVHEALDRELGARVALKTLRPEIADDPEALARFRQEIALARQITHPNVCRIYDLFQDRREDGRPLYFVTMELLEGETLGRKIQRDGPLSPRDLLPIVEQIASGLEAAHRVGVVHRDLKPGNVILLTREGGEGPRAVITDFGLAVTLTSSEESRLTRVGQLVGTPAYMAPEQLTGGEVTAATDIYALGLLVYEALTGELPFAKSSPFSGALQRLATPPPSLRSQIPNLPVRWERAVTRCLESDPGERFRGVFEVVRALEGRSIWLSRNRRPGWRSGVAVVLLALTAAAIWQFVGDSVVPIPQAPSERSAAQDRAARHVVLIPSFDNRTGNESLDGVLESALSRELVESPTVESLPRNRIAETLQLMREPENATIDRIRAQEIARRDGEVTIVIGGAIERLGSSYLLSAELVDPEDGAVVASFEEEASGEDEVLGSTRRLAEAVRRFLEEERPAEMAAREHRLARVATTSLRALELYTKAGSFGLARNPAAAEELLRQAVAEDPEFASAYMRLAEAIQVQGRPEEEYLPLAERAMELADTTPLGERYGIRNGYFLMTGRHDQAIANIVAQAELESEPLPPGMFAIYAFELGRYEEAVPYAVAWAEIETESWFANFQAARALTDWGNRPEEAAPYAARATELLEHAEVDDLTPLASWFASWARAFPAHLLWLEGDVEGVAELADAWHEELRSDPSSSLVGREWPSFVALVYRGIGRLASAEEVYRSAGESGRYVLARARGDEETVRAILQRESRRPLDQDQSGGRGTALAIELARAGMIEAARSVTEALAERETGSRSYGGGRRPTPAMVAAARGELALAEGRTSEAMPLLEWAARGLRASGLEAYFRVVESMAGELERRGEEDRAVALLEEASRQRGRLHGWSKLPWMEVRLLLADLYRRQGREEAAERVLTELRSLLALADPDHLVLRELERRRSVP